MSTAPTLPAVSVEEYLRTDYEPRCEYVDGVLVPKAVSDYRHNRLARLLLRLLAVTEDQYGFEALREQHVRVTAMRYRIPDICALVEPPIDGRYPDSRQPPLFTIEIVSPEETWTELWGKISDHLAMGVPLVILADPYNKTVLVATQEQPLHELSAPLIVNVNVPGRGVFQIDFDDLYRRLSEE